MCRYVSYLYFQLRTHHSLFMEEENDEEPAFSAGAAIVLLCLITILVAFASECALLLSRAASSCAVALLGVCLLCGGCQHAAVPDHHPRGLRLRVRHPLCYPWLCSAACCMLA